MVISQKLVEVRRPVDGSVTRRKYIHVGSVAASMPQHGHLSIHQAA
jgi:hypothetical protein